MDKLIGSTVIIRTVTNYFTGRLVEENGRWLILEEAAWIADTGRWAQALAKGTLNEVEPYPDGQKVMIGVGSIIDITAWQHELPRATK